MEADASETVRLTESQIGPAAATLARAFHDYPAFVYVFPDVSQREDELPLLFRNFVHFGVLNGEVYATSPDLEGVAVWTPPDHTRVSPLPPEVSKDALDRMAYWGRQTGSIRHGHVPSAHWFLMIIGVNPEFQGRGHGVILLAPMLARIEQEGAPCYLDTELEENVALYQHFGFRVVDDTVIPDTGVRSWGMVRECSG